MFSNRTYAFGMRGLWGWYLQDDTAIDIEVEIGNTSQINETNNIISSIMGYLQIIGSIISVLALVIIGLRYMFSTLEEKAQMKGILIYYVVGAILVFATSNVLSIAYKVISGITM
jgi:uncharacterized membrane protein (UPF0136 family)